jgi:hypothetical protein
MEWGLITFLGLLQPGKDDHMNTAKTNIDMMKAEQPDLVKRIGNTTYQVKIHFNPNSKETIKDKIIRMIRNEVSQSHKQQGFQATD